MVVIIFAIIVVIGINWFKKINRYNAEFSGCVQHIQLFKNYLKDGEQLPTIFRPKRFYIGYHKVDSFFCAGNNDFYYMDGLEKVIYKIHIIKFKGLKNINFKNIIFKQGVNLENIHLFSKEKFEVNTSSMDINLGNSSKIKKVFSGSGYKGFYGIIYKMSFSNQRNEHLIVVDNTDLPEKKEIFGTMFPVKDFSSQFLLLLYKNEQDLYAIIINATGRAFNDTKIINLFNFVYSKE